ncbi:MAG: DUF5662 family protein [Oscillospiraceae bacterium]
MHPLAHLKTINHHRWLVCKSCFRLGLYWQGLTHDLSKYHPREFWVGAKYYQGYRSPNDAERQDTGVSTAWLRHKGRNRHHLEYWIDYSPMKEQGMVGMEMPPRYVAEMFCDRIAACKTYHGESYSPGDPYDFFVRSKPRIIFNAHSAALLEQMMLVLRDEGEDAAYAWIRREVLHNAKK